MTKEQMKERLTKVQAERQTLAQNIDNAVMRLHQMDGKIDLLNELINGLVSDLTSGLPNERAAIGE